MIAMYHCHIQFYFIGRCRGILEAVKKIPPMEHFTHTFSESEESKPERIAQADVIFALLQEQDAEKTLRALTAHRKKEAEIILLASWEQIGPEAEGLLEIGDVWAMPLSEREIKFRFEKWQRDYKLKKDLWQSDQFLEAVMDSCPDMIWFKDKDGIHERVNESFCRTVHKTKDQVQGRGHAYIWNVEHDDPACMESEKEVMETKETRVSDEVVLTEDGERPLTTYKSPLYDLDGTVMGTVGVGVDIAKERAYEKEILEKSQTLEMLFATMDCGVMYHSIDGTRLLRINRAALNLLGYESQEELMQDGFFLIAQSVLDEDKPKLRECIQSLKKVGDSVSTEYRVQHKDGTILDLLGNIKLMEENGELFYQRFILDFTAQRKQEAEKWAEKDQEIQYQEQLFEIFSTFLSENVDDIYMMLDEKAETVEFVSPNIKRVLGISWQSLKNDLSLLSQAAYADGETVSREDIAQMEPGMPPIVAETERIHQQTGEHRWFCESIYCVSVQGEKQIIVYISDRTKERLHQNTLTEALDMAKVASKAKSTFLSNVSHDIRTPMNAITGFITLLQEETDNPEHVAEYAQKISAASQHLLGLIDDVLDMNKIESGSAVLNISELNLAELIEELNAIIRPQAREKGQEFDIATDSLSNEHLLGDKLRISQILINILSNAVKYTQYGGSISVTVKELPQVAPNYSRIQFTISDNGQGMSKEYQEVIFDPFTREQDTLLNQIQGTGLGMAVTKGLVDLMNGTISVTSELGKGSTFVVELDLRIQSQEEDPKFWEKHRLTRMIVVDDDEDICRDIVRKMAKTGVDTKYATSGHEAIELMRTEREAGRPFDLILLDWKMPDLDGIATARLIRNNYPEKIPLLLFTSYDWMDIEEEALEVGIKHFLPKPFFMTNFKAAIQWMMGKEQQVSPISSNTIINGKHILVVDDIDVNRLILIKILSAMGASCDEAVNGQEAVEAFKNTSPENSYDIILMDVQMPILNGYEATRAIRASGHPLAEKVAILAMTANAFVDDIREALDSGMDAHIAKPIVVEHLKNTIQEVMDRKKEG